MNSLKSLKQTVNMYNFLFVLPLQLQCSGQNLTRLPTALDSVDLGEIVYMNLSSNKISKTFFSMYYDQQNSCCLLFFFISSFCQGFGELQIIGDSYTG